MKNLNKPYVSSIISKYGDTDKVSFDSARVFDVLDRQGMSLLIDLIAEYSGRNANKFKMNTEERKRIIETLVAELNESLSERL